jgi:hypothetical protein
VYELRTVKSPKTTLDVHKTSITCVAQQSYSRVCYDSMQLAIQNLQAKFFFAVFQPLKILKIIFFQRSVGILRSR